MTDSSDSPTKVHAQALVDDPAHYIDSVSAMADSRELSAAEDIVSSSGIKLVGRGTRIDASLREKLRGHGLSGKVLEQRLSITGGVNPESLANDIGNLYKKDAWLKRLETRSGDPGAMRYGVSYLKLPREILFRLTVARDQRPDLYHHSISVAVISHYLALRLQSEAINHQQRSGWRPMPRPRRTVYRPRDSQVGARRYRRGASFHLRASGRRMADGTRIGRR